MTGPVRHGEGGGSSQYDPATASIMPTCMWDGCDNPGPIADLLGLIPPGSKVIRNVRVAVCARHRAEWRRTGRFMLFTHPDNLLGQ